MDKLKIEDLPESVGIYKKQSNTMYYNTKRNGWGVSLNLTTFDVTFGTWTPCGAQILKVKVNSLEEFVKLLEDAQDVVAYKKRIQEK